MPSLSRAQVSAALLAALAPFAAGCHGVLLREVTLTPRPSLTTPHLAVEVLHAGLSPTCLTFHEICAESALAVSLELSNTTTTEMSVFVEDARLVLRAGAAAPTERTASASGAGPLRLEVDERSNLGVVTLPPRGRVQIWVLFRNFSQPGDPRWRPRTSIVVPFQSPSGPQQEQEVAEVVIVDPTRATPTWSVEAPSLVNGQISAAWLNVPGRGLVYGVPRTNFDIFTVGFVSGFSKGPWLWRSEVAVGWLTGIDTGSERDHFGFTYGGQIGRALSHRTGRGALLSLAPTAGVQLGYFRADDPLSSVDPTRLLGLQAGLSFLLDRDVPWSGPFPLAPVSPRHGSVAGLQLLYVHWIGAIVGEPIGPFGAGFLASFFLGFNLL